MTLVQLLAMKLHDTVDIGMYITILKVLGGWIYIYKTDKGAVSEFVSSRGKDRNA